MFGAHNKKEKTHTIEKTDAQNVYVGFVSPL
jgi:hypothetical protein